MRLIKLSILIIIVITLKSVSLNLLNGKCGYPGKPYQAKLEPDNKLQYDEGEEVNYQCTHFWSFVQTRKCEKGKWSGPQPRCGDFVTGILMKDSRLEDISDQKNPILIFEHLDMKLTNRSWKYPNVFTSYRFEKARLRVFDTKKYKWTLNFTGPAVKLFVRIGFNFINYTLLPQEVKDNFTFNISINVSPYRNCQLIHQSDDKWRENGRKMDNDFICDSISAEGAKSDSRNPGDYILMETQASIDIPHDLLTIFLGKSYGTEEEPLCGDPEVGYSHSSRFNAQFKDYSIECKKDKYEYISTSNNILPDTALHGLKCKEDMRWQGSYPDCIPKKPCSLANLHVAKEANSTMISSFEGLYFFNESLFYAIEGTEVNYVCFNPSTDILVGKEKRECLKTGKWTGTEPHCYNPTESSKFPVWLLIAILFGALVLIICLTAILFFVYTKRIKTRISKQISRQNQIENDKLNETYDDICYSGDKQIYDTYETVEDEGEARYTDPYYNSKSEYVQIPSNAKSGVGQSSDDYWRLPIIEPTYLAMTNSNKSSPNVPRKPPVINAPDEQIYTYQL